MYRAKLALDYLKYRLVAKTTHGVHSPFVYQFNTDVLYDSTPFYPFQQLNLIRQHLLQDSSILDVVDLGAGSKVQTSNKRSVQGIANTALSDQKFMELYFRMVNYFSPKNILELGTSLGLTTSYMAQVNKNTPVTTIEGSPSIAQYSRKVLKKQKLSNVKVLEGNFDDVLPELLKTQNIPFDFVFVDGNHSYNSTLKYFNLIIDQCAKDSVIIFDDIRWSEGMLKAWNEIKSDNRIQVSIDLFKVGLVFLREGQEKEDFVICF